MPVSWSDLLSGKTADALFTELLDSLRGLGLPVDDWAEGAALRTVLKVALSPSLSRLWDAASAIAQGGLLRLAQALAEADPVAWADNPQGSWLYLLARQLYNVEIKLAGFTSGLMRFVNNGAAPQNATTAVVVSYGSSSFQVTTATMIPAGATVYVPVRATNPGSLHNISSGLTLTLNVSLPGVTVTSDFLAPALSWVTSPGYDQETPMQLADRCAVRWGRLTRLQTAPADGWISAALDAHPAVKKVAVWSDFNPDIAAPGFQAQSVTLYLGSDTLPVDAATAAAVDAAMRPYIGVCDRFFARPCGTQTLTLTGTIYTSTAAIIPTVRAAVDAAILAFRKDLKIGEKVYAWKIRDLVGVPGVVNFVETLTDFTPNKNALVDINTASLVYLPVT